MFERTNGPLRWFHQRKSTHRKHQPQQVWFCLFLQPIFSLKVDYQQRCVWVGTISSGLFKINLDKLGKIISVEQFSEQMTGSYKIPNNSIWSFFQAKNGAFYMGTDTGLLLKKPNETQFQPILAEDVQNKKIMGIVADEFSNLWLSNSQGIIKYNPN